MCLPYNVLRKGKILVSTFVGLRRGEGRKTAPDWSEEKMRGKVKSKKRMRLILAVRYVILILLLCCMKMLYEKLGKDKCRSAPQRFI